LKTRDVHTAAILESLATSEVELRGRWLRADPGGEVRGESDEDETDGGERRVGYGFCSCFLLLQGDIWVVDEDASLADHGKKSGNGLCICVMARAAMMAAKRLYAIRRNQKKVLLDC
jgi:hypothetical protein